MDERVISAHAYSMNNEPMLRKDKKCGCFYCLRIFDPSEIEEWIEDEMSGGVNLYAMNVSTLSKVHMVGGVGSAQYANGHVVTTSITGSAGNYPVYTFKENGTGKVKVANAFWALFRGNYLYFTKFRYKDGNGRFVSQYRVYRSDYSGKSPKAVTGWVSYNEIPRKYRR